MPIIFVDYFEDIEDQSYKWLILKVLVIFYFIKTTVRKRELKNNDSAKKSWSNNTILILKSAIFKRRAFHGERRLGLIPKTIKRNLLPPPGLVKNKVTFSLKPQITEMRFFHQLAQTPSLQGAGRTGEDFGWLLEVKSSKFKRGVKELQDYFLRIIFNCICPMGKWCSRIHFLP